MQIILCASIGLTLFWLFIRRLPYDKRMHTAFVSLPAFLLMILFYVAVITHWVFLSGVAKQTHQTFLPLFEQNELGASIMLMFSLLYTHVYPFILSITHLIIGYGIALVTDPWYMLPELGVLIALWVVFFGKQWMRSGKVFFLTTYQRIQYVFTRKGAPEKVPYGYVPSAPEKTLLTHLRVFFTGMRLSLQPIIVRTLIYIITPWVVIALCGLVYWMVSVKTW